MSEVQNDYLIGSGGNYTFKAGVNHNVKLKSWSIEKNEKEGKTSFYLKLTYVQPTQGVEEKDWSTINELLNFPGFPQGKSEVNKNTVKYGFVSPISAFITNFATKEEVNERIKAVFQKLGITDFVFTDEAVLHGQLETLVKGLFSLVETKGLFQLEGTLVCGFANPKIDAEGNVKQYLQPAKYGQSGCYKHAFRTNNDEELPSEKTGGFKDDNDKKYNYWSYTRTKSETSSTPAPTQEAPASTDW